jgi:hypothetical protein
VTFDLKVRETHEQRISTVISSKELEKLVAEVVAARASVRLKSQGVSFKVSFEKETEGSPPYRTGTKARVEITVDLRDQPAAAT